MEQSVRVFIVDDHAVVRGGVRYLLEQSGAVEVIGEAGTVAAALDGVAAGSPDVLIADVRLPDGNGVELVREVRSRFPEIRCVILTSFADDEAFFHAVVAGAAGYLVKDVDAVALVSAVQTVAAGGSLISRDVIDDLRRRATEVPPDDDLLSGLTPQERRILGMVTEGLTNREIAVKLSLAEKTIRNYVSNILGQVGMRNRTELAAYVARLTAKNLAARA